MLFSSIDFVSADHFFFVIIFNSYSINREVEASSSAEAPNGPISITIRRDPFIEGPVTLSVQPTLTVQELMHKLPGYAPPAALCVRTVGLSFNGVVLDVPTGGSARTLWDLGIRSGDMLQQLSVRTINSNLCKSSMEAMMKARSTDASWKAFLQFYTTDHPELVNMDDDRFPPALHYACAMGNVDAIKDLIQVGADVSLSMSFTGADIAGHKTKCLFGRTALHVAILADHWDVACLLMRQADKAAANAAAAKEQRRIARAEERMNATARENDDEEEDEDDEDEDDEDGGASAAAGGLDSSCVLTACAAGRCEVLQSILDYCAYNASASGAHGPGGGCDLIRTAYQEGAFGGDEEDGGGGGGGRGEDARTPWSVAVDFNQEAVVRWLLASGIPLDAAADVDLGVVLNRHRNFDLACLLIEQGAECGVYAADGWDSCPVEVRGRLQAALEGSKRP